jgi:D-alanyl-D-alanine carboxypeptidase
MDGSLAGITGFTSDPSLAGARGQVQAKTGTFAEEAEGGGILVRGEAFGGYIRSRGGRDLAYQLVVNDVGPLPGFEEVISVIEDLGVVTALIWRDN